MSTSFVSEAARRSDELEQRQSLSNADAVAPEAASTMQGAAMKGWLWKEQPHWPFTWQKRWFALEGDTLYYWSKGDEKPRTLPLKGANIMSSKTPRKATTRWVWRLSLNAAAAGLEQLPPPGHTKYVLAADTEAESVSWIGALVAAADVRVGLAVRVLSATAVPWSDPMNPDPYVRVQLLPEDDPEATTRKCVVEARTHARNGSSPSWDELLLLPPGPPAEVGDEVDVSDAEAAKESKPAAVVKRGSSGWFGKGGPPMSAAIGSIGAHRVLRFAIYDKEKITWDEYIGEVRITVGDLLRRPTRTLLVSTREGEPVVSGSPPRPCELTISMPTLSWTNLAWPSPQPSIHDSTKYAKHVLMLTRGTRGDVQPFVALARGLAQQRNWLCTICTELRWRDYVHKHAKGLSAGAIRFVPSGGDTDKRMSIWIAQQLFQMKTELVQALFLAMAEADFFGSVPVFVRHAQQLVASTQGLDMITCGFTVTGAGMLCSELVGVPFVPFILQPSSIPSSDPEWRCLEEIQTPDSWTLMSSMEHAFTSHTTLTNFKALTEGNSLTHGLPKLRVRYGLKPASTWKTLQAINNPVVMPFKPTAFNTPADWPSRFILSDFIFLRTSSGGAGNLDAAVSSFIEANRTKGRKLLLMTFSSMPVERRQMLLCANKMIKEAKTPLSVLIVGTQLKQSAPQSVLDSADVLKSQGSLLEVATADFGVLFPFMDLFVVHGGLGTTVEALRMKKPIAVTGILLMDQRWWGKAVERFGVGPGPTHITDFSKICVEFVDKALAPGSEWQATAETLDWGDVHDDGVTTNVDAFAKLLEEGIKPVILPPK